MDPKISVVIAAYNEAKLLPRSIESLQKQDYPKDKLEIIVADNGSTDGTTDIARKYGVNVYIYTEVQGCGPSRKYGASKATGDIVAFFDADTEALPGWLQQMKKDHAEPNVVCVGGSAIADDNKFLSKLAFGFYDAFHIFHHWIGRPIMGGYNMTIKKSAYDAVGGYDIQLLACEDWDLSLRLAKKFGRKNIKYDLDLKVKASARKVNSPGVMMQYLFDYIQNYTNLMILGKKKIRPTFTVR